MCQFCSVWMNVFVFVVCCLVALILALLSIFPAFRTYMHIYDVYT